MLKSRQLLGALESPDAGLEQISMLIRVVAMCARGPETGMDLGLLSNIAMEMASHDESSHAHVQTYVRRITAAFENALSGAVEAGKIELTSDLSTEASFFTSHLLGQLTLIRSNVAPEVVESAATEVLAHLASLRPRVMEGP